VKNFTAPQVTPGINACSNAWRDLDPLLEAGDLFLADEQGNQVYLKNLKSEKANNGASIRYAIAVSP